MQELSDAQLLRDYAVHGHEAAFREIVTRHTDVVYSSALRQVGSPEQARDVAQNVFGDLARKAKPLAGELAGNASLLGWLYRSTRFAALTLLRDERRRHARERQVMEHFNPASEESPDWDRVSPVLDEAMADLNDEDREALLLRFFKNHDFRAVGAALGVSDDAAQKRVSRALERLRAHITRRGVTTTAVALTTALSANATAFAPAGLAATLSSAALAGTTVAITATATATKVIAMTTLQKTVITATVAALAGLAIYEARQASQLRDQVQTLQQQQAPLAEQIKELHRNQSAANQSLAALKEENERLRNNTGELLRLRSELAQMKATGKVQNDTLQAEMRSWLERLHQLKARLDQMPDQTIPELQFVNEATWLDVTRDRLNTDEEFRRAFSRLRNSGESKFAGMLKLALGAYGEANEGLFPTAVAQLKPFFPTPVDDALLQRFEVLPAENVKLKRPVALPALPNGYFIVQRHRVDEELDQRWIIYSNGIAAVTRDVEISIGPFGSHSR